ncbi:deoxyribodipyrimidine photo-lyase [Candidatus Dependentiae bacterium]|nr:deoxyribodipyrimidine photo-lyase [Candidatus Dependentiae bacterium]MBU4387546.1 deoxyribodipyrimidine photo-lyase [Candidatus Dependentiae bacterium]MCG2756584.1 deoxyribodipyrimidine photo-lyase [Candidatus Dependentiae bacterium]
MKENIKKRSICFIFRNDLRLNDNLGLIEALKTKSNVLPLYLAENLNLFCKNNYNNQQFIVESLIDLDLQLDKFGSKLLIIKNIKDLESIINEYNIKAFYINKLYHPLHLKQELEILKLCKKNNLEFKSLHDFLLHDLDVNKKIYKVYTPFLIFFSKKQILVTQKNNYKNYFSKKYIKNHLLLKNILNKKNKNLHKHGGSSNALKIIKNIKNYKNYKDERDIPAIDGTTKLSAYINVGAISIRTVYHEIVKEFGNNHEIIRQLYWREFYYQLYYGMPELFNSVLRPRNIKWKQDKIFLNSWKNAKTGIELVDAGMKELNVSGFMHNRIRMLTANYLALKKWINWELGEKYFAEKLTDYDPILNNGNWQYMAQVGANMAPFPRVLNPELQQKKFDKQKIYIKKWLTKD